MQSGNIDQWCGDCCLKRSELGDLLPELFDLVLIEVAALDGLISLVGGILEGLTVIIDGLLDDVSSGLLYLAEQLEEGFDSGIIVVLVVVGPGL